MAAAKSNHQHRMQGTYRKDRHGALLLQPDTPPRPPADLSKGAKVKWRSVAKRMAEAGTITALDLDALAVYCETFVTWRSAVATVKREGETYKIEGGLVKRHPSVAIAQQAARDLLAAAGQLGLTPAARSRLRIELPTAEAASKSRLFANRTFKIRG